jgi:hypothetical protein
MTLADIIVAASRVRLVEIEAEQYVQGVELDMLDTPERRSNVLLRLVVLAAQKDALLDHIDHTLKATA